MKSPKVLILQGAILFLLSLSACSSGEDNSAPEEKTAPVVKSVIHTIEISKMKFVPEEIVVKKGDQVVFVNRDLTDHDVTEANKEWSSSPLQTDKYWTLVATVSQDYYCSLHPVMKGKIIVL